MPADASPITVEFETNLLAPARGERMVARGRVERPGRTLTVARADASAIGADGRERHVAIMLATVMCLDGVPETGGARGC